MSAELERLEQQLTGLRDERASIEATLTREDVGGKVAEYLWVARAHAAGSSRLAFSGQAAGADLEAILAEDLLADDGLAVRLVKRLEALGFGEFSDRQKTSKLKALDEKIAAATGELREARKRQALEEVERQFAGEAA